MDRGRDFRVEHAPAHHVLAAAGDVTPCHAAFAGLAIARLEVVGVVAEAKLVRTDLPVRVDAELFARVPEARFELP